jgi:TonB family protein
MHPAVPIYVAGAPWPKMLRPGRIVRPYATFTINVDAVGRVADAKLQESTGDSALDEASAAALKRWTFLPRVRIDLDGGYYFFIVTFDPNG